MTLEPLVQTVPADVEALKAYYTKEGKLKTYVREFRIARNKSEEKLAALPSRFIPKMCKVMDEAGVPVADAKKIIYADARSLGWTHSGIIHNWPKHYVNPKWAEFGASGGKKAAQNAAQKRGLAAADEATRARVATSGGEARAGDVAGLSKAGKMGGEAVKKLYGPSYYSDIGSKAHTGEAAEPVEQLITGQFEVNPLEWKDSIFTTIEEAIAQQRNVVFVLHESKLVTVRPAGVKTGVSQSPVA
jgi:hypothetical protein